MSYSRAITLTLFALLVTGCAETLDDPSEPVTVSEQAAETGESVSATRTEQAPSSREQRREVSLLNPCLQDQVDPADAPPPRAHVDTTYRRSTEPEPDDDRARRSPHDTGGMTPAADPAPSRRDQRRGEELALEIEELIHAGRGDEAVAIASENGSDGAAKFTEAMRGMRGFDSADDDLALEDTL